MRFPTCRFLLLGWGITGLSPPTTSESRVRAAVYAAEVAEGYRPPRPNRMDPELYDLIEWCWKVGDGWASDCPPLTRKVRDG